MTSGAAREDRWPDDEADPEVDDQVMTSEEFAAYGAELARKCGMAPGGPGLANGLAGRSGRDPGELGTARKLSGAELARLCAADFEGTLTATEQARLDEHYRALKAEADAGHAAIQQRVLHAEEREAGLVVHPCRLTEDQLLELWRREDEEGMLPAADRVRLQGHYLAGGESRRGHQMRIGREAVARHMREEQKAHWAAVASPEKQAEAEQVAKLTYAAYQRAYEEQERRYDALCEDRIVLNRSDPGGPGSSPEHVAALREIVADLAFVTREWPSPLEGRLFTLQRVLVEYDPELDPPAVRVTEPAQLREMLDRLTLLAHGSGPSLYRLTSEGKLEDAPLSAISGDAVRQALRAPRWPEVPALPVRGTANRIAGRSDVPPPITQLILAVMQPGQEWAGSMTELATLLGWDGTPHALSRALRAAIPALAAKGVLVAPARQKTGPTGRKMWTVSRIPAIEAPQAPRLPPSQ
jgi:hypothetical protein